MATRTARAESLSEYADSRGRSLSVDAPAGIIRGVKVLGLESKNGRTYAPGAVASAVSLYEGAKVNVNHPAGRPDAPRDYRDRIGVLRSVRAEPDGLYADLHFNTKHALAEQLAWDAQHAPENVGLSHNVEGKTVSRSGRVVVEAITSVTSVDLVADPATTRGLFEHQQTNQSGARSVSETITLADVKANAAILEELRREILAEQAGSEAAKQQAEQVKALKEELDRLKAEKALAGAKAAVDAMIAESKLPKELVTDLLHEQMLSADEAGRKRIIEDRQAIAKSIPHRPTAGVARSKDQSFTEAAAAGVAPSKDHVKSRWLTR